MTKQDRIERYDLVMADLLPSEAEERAWHPDSDDAMTAYRPPNNPMDRIYRDLMHKQIDLMADHMEGLVQQTQYMHEQVARSSANANAHYKLARHRARVLAWMRDNLALTDEDGEDDTLMREVIDYALTNKAGSANAPF